MLQVQFCNLQRTFQQAIRSRFFPSRLQRSPKQKHEKMERVESLIAPDEFDSLSPTFTALGLRDEKTVTAFLNRLKPSERNLIYDIIHRKRTLQYEPPKVPIQIPVHYDELRSVWWLNYLPYLVYGFFDMGTMIVAGESFDKVIGLQMGISPMGGAAVGNLISNGLGLAVVYYSSLFVVHIRKPNLLPGQEEEWRVLWVQHVARVFGLLSGCVLGMFPLLFFDSPERPAPVRSLDVEESEAEDAELERRETDSRYPQFGSLEEWQKYGGNVFNENLCQEYENYKRNWSALLNSSNEIVGDSEDNDDVYTRAINSLIKRNSDGTPIGLLICQHEFDDQFS
ncbi:Transmembrane protein 65 isoform X2 [Aphelenchoides besseyi]|nr:Transmembrane protein 65 isoform X2 [Aphelenchoides besseyi]KAI6195252.1 Transmembrane protein 65 isoform X2 [Aphelenchoides besseyi]